MTSRISELISRHRGKAFALCYSMVADPHDAEDLAHESLVKALQASSKLRDDAKFLPWLRQIARNTCLDFLRKKKRIATAHDQLEAQLNEASPPPAEFETLRAAILQLPENFRLPLFLYYFDDESTESIAAMLEIKPATVHSRISRARKLLRDELSPQQITATQP